MRSCLPCAITAASTLPGLPPSPACPPQCPGSPHPCIPQLRPGNISHDELVQTAFLLLVAGNATVATQIDLGVMSLLQHPDQVAREARMVERLSPAICNACLAACARSL